MRYMFWSIAVVVFCLGSEIRLAQAADNAPLPSSESASHMTLPDGFHVTLCAAEPEVRQPIAFAFDDRGRLWVVENYSYPRWSPADTKEGHDRVLIFDDPDGNGHFRSRKVFTDKAVNVSGIAVGFGGVWLCSSPNLVFIPMRDGEDVPSGPPQIVLDGWNIADAKHNVFSRIEWAPDGWLWGCNGINSRSKVGPPGTSDAERVRLDTGVWRYHPVRKVFELVASGGTNPWGLDFNDYGQPFITNCVINHLWHIIPGGHYQRMFGNDVDPNSYTLMGPCADHIHWGGGEWTTSRGGVGKHGLAGGGHAHAGAMIYLGDNWPDEMRNSIFMCNIHGNRVNNDILEHKGSGYVGHHGKDFLMANDPWFRGLDLHYGPDGGVYVIDWCDTGECHNYDKIDPSNGRIYKITYGSAAPRTDLATLNVATMSDAELVKLQLHKNDWYVRRARRLLQERAAAGKLTGDTAASLLAILKENPDVTRKLRALWALNAIGAAPESLLLEQMGAKDEYVRAWAIQLAVDEKKASDAALAKFAQLAKDDPSATVRLALSSAMQRVDTKARWPIAEALTAHAEDDSDADLPLMDWYAVEPSVAAEPEHAVKLIASAKLPVIREFSARRIAPTALAQLVGLLSGNDDATVQGDVLRGILAAFSESRRVAMPDGWAAVYPKLNQSPARDVREHARVLSLLFGDDRVLPSLRQVVADTKADVTERTNALQGLVQVRDSQLTPLLQQLLTDAKLSGAAVRALAAFGNDETTKAIIDRYPQFNDSDKRDAVITLASRSASAMAMLDAVEKGTIPHLDVSNFVVRQLQSLSDEKVTARLTAIWGTARPPAKDKAARIADYKNKYGPNVLKYADRTHGRLLFTKSCGQCHVLFDSGGTLAPNLTGAQRSNLDYLLGKILDPNAVVPKDFQMTVVQKKDGEVVNGIVAKDTPQALTLKTPSGNVVIAVEDIARRKTQPISMMPEGLLDGLNFNDAKDLLAYLSGPDQVPLPEK